MPEKLMQKLKTMLMQQTIRLLFLLTFLMEWGIGWGQCNADFSFSNGGSCSQFYTFSADTTGNSSTAEYQWTIDDNTFFGISASYNFQDFGCGISTYNVVLVVTDPTCVDGDSFVQTIQVDEVPDATISDIDIFEPWAECGGEEMVTLTLENESSTGSCNTFYHLDWGDNTFYEGSTFPSQLSHDYLEEGIYNLILTVTGSNGCESTTNYSFFFGGNPSIGLEIPQLASGPCAPDTIEFEITGFENNTSGTLYSIYISSDGSIPPIPIPPSPFVHPPPENFAHIFQTSSCGFTSIGNFGDAFHARIIAENACGQASALVEPIRINTIPQAKIDTFCVKSTCPGETVTICEDIINAGYYIASSGNCTDAVTIQWEINPNDGTWEIEDGALDEECFDIVFYETGSYEVRLIVENPCGNSHAVKNITVQEVPTADFEIAPISGAGCVPFKIELENNSIFQTGNNWNLGNPTGWSFCPGFDEFSENPQIQFNTAGIYVIDLDAINGCSTDSHQDTIVVADVPLVAIDPIENGCGIAIINPIGQVGENNATLANVNWIFSGGNPVSSNLLIPGNVNYPIWGLFDVTFEATNECGANSTTTSFEIFEIPFIEPILDIEVCETDDCFLPEPITLGGIWYFNGLQIDSFCPVTEEEGCYFLTYRIETGVENCFGEDSVKITVHLTPEIQLHQTDTLICVNSDSIILSANPTGGIFKIGNNILENNVFHPESWDAQNEICYCYTDTITGCSNQECFTIEVAGLLEIEIPDTSFLCDIMDCINLEEEFVIPEIGYEVFWFGDAIKDSEAGLFSLTTGDLVAGDTTMVYYEVVSDEGCISEDSLMISIIEFVQATISQDTTVCVTDSCLTLIANPDSCGIWLGDEIDENGKIDLYAALGTLPSVTLTYTYIYKEGKSCESIASAEVTIIDAIGPNAGPDIEVCETEECITLIPDFVPDNTEIVWSGPEIDSVTGKINIQNLVPGCYEYTMEAISNILNLCKSTDVVQVCVMQNVITGIEIPETICINDTIQFTSTSSMNATVFSWTFENGNSLNPTIANPEVIFSESGWQTVTLAIWSENSLTGELLCQDMISDSVFVIPDVEVDISVDVTEGCGPLWVTIINNSSPADAGITIFIDEEPYSFTDDTLTIILNPGKTDTIYILSVGAGNACSNETFSQEITVFPQPIANVLTNQDEYCNGEIIEANYNLCGNPDSIVWTRDGIFYSNAEDTIFIFEDANTVEKYHEICVTVFNECGQDMACDTILIKPDSCTAFFNIPTDEFCVGDSIFFTNGSTPNKIILYDFGDIYNITTTTSNEENPVFAYTQPGTYIVSLKVFGCGYHERFDTLTIHPVAAPNFEISSPICVGDELIITDNSTDGFGHFWDFGNEYTISSSMPIYAYDTAGIYTISLSLENEFGCSEIFMQEVEVIALPEPLFTVPSTFCKGADLTPINLTDQSPLSYFWNFGEDSIEYETIMPIYQYQNSGDFVITLRVEDVFGCAASTQTTIQVLQAPEIDLVIAKEDSCEMATVVLNSTINHATHFDIFVNDSLESSNNLENLSAGNYNIQIVAENNNQCQTIYQDSFEIYPSPRANSITHSVQCFGFNDGAISIQITGGNAPYFSNLIFPNGDKVSGTNFSGLRPGDYEIIVTDAMGCQTNEFAVIFEPEPISLDLFTNDSTHILMGDSVRLELDYLAASPIFEWTPNASLSCDSCVSATARPLLTTLYTVTLTDEFGCTEIDTLTIFVDVSRIVFLPNVFTPNDDGLNDVFYVRSGNPSVEEIEAFIIFDRWGQTVFEAQNFQPNDRNFGWDGKIEGEESDRTEYTWMAAIRFLDGKVKIRKGNVLKMK